MEQICAGKAGKEREGDVLFLLPFLFFSKFVVGKM